MSPNTSHPSPLLDGHSGDGDAATQTHSHRQQGSSALSTAACSSLASSGCSSTALTMRMGSDVSVAAGRPIAAPTTTTHACAARQSASIQTVSSPQPPSESEEEEHACIGGDGQHAPPFYPAEAKVPTNGTAVYYCLVLANPFSSRIVAPPLSLASKKKKNTEMRAVGGDSGAAPEPAGPPPAWGSLSTPADTTLPQPMLNDADNASAAGNGCPPPSAASLSSSPTPIDVAKAESTYFQHSYPSDAAGPPLPTTLLQHPSPPPPTYQHLRTASQSTAAPQHANGGGGPSFGDGPSSLQQQGSAAMRAANPNGSSLSILFDGGAQHTPHDGGGGGADDALPLPQRVATALQADEHYRPVAPIRRNSDTSSTGGYDTGGVGIGAGVEASAGHQQRAPQRFFHPNMSSVTDEDIQRFQPWAEGRFTDEGLVAVDTSADFDKTAEERRLLLERAIVEMIWRLRLRGLIVEPSDVLVKAPVPRGERRRIAAIGSALARGRAEAAAAAEADEYINSGVHVGPTSSSRADATVSSSGRGGGGGGARGNGNGGGVFTDNSSFLGTTTNFLNTTRILMQRKRHTKQHGAGMADAGGAMGTGTMDNSSFEGGGATIGGGVDGDGGDGARGGGGDSSAAWVDAYMDLQLLPPIYTCTQSNASSFPPSSAQHRGHRAPTGTATESSGDFPLPHAAADDSHHHQHHSDDAINAANGGSDANYHYFRLNRDVLYTSKVGHDTGRHLYLKVTGSRDALLGYAEATEMMLRTHPLSDAGGAVWGYTRERDITFARSVRRAREMLAEEAYLEEVAVSNWGSPELSAAMRAKADREAVEDLYKKGAPDRDPIGDSHGERGFIFRAPEKFRTIEMIIRDPFAFGGCGLQVKEMAKRNMSLVEAFFPLHDRAELQRHGLYEWCSPFNMVQFAVASCVPLAARQWLKLKLDARRGGGKGKVKQQLEASKDGAHQTGAAEEKVAVGANEPIADSEMAALTTTPPVAPPTEQLPIISIAETVAAAAAKNIKKATATTAASLEDGSPSSPLSSSSSPILSHRFGTYSEGSVNTPLLWHRPYAEAHHEAILSYFGEHVSLYFLWLHEMINFLPCVAALGVVCAVLPYINHYIYASITHMVFAILCVLWGAGWVLRWERHEHEFIVRYQQQRLLTSVEVRDEFKAGSGGHPLRLVDMLRLRFDVPFIYKRAGSRHQQQDESDPRRRLLFEGRVERGYTPAEMLSRMRNGGMGGGDGRAENDAINFFVQYDDPERYQRLVRIATCWFIILVIIAGQVAIVTYLTKWRYDNVGDVVVSYGSSIIGAVASAVISIVFDVVVVKSNEFENYPTEGEEEHAKVRKSFLYSFCSFYYPMFIIALYPSKASNTERLDELQTQMIIICVAKPIFQNFVEIMVPLAMPIVLRWMKRLMASCACRCSCACCCECCHCCDCCEGDDGKGARGRRAARNRARRRLARQRRENAMVEMMAAAAAADGAADGSPIVSICGEGDSGGGGSHTTNDGIKVGSNSNSRHEPIADLDEAAEDKASSPQRQRHSVVVVGGGSNSANPSSLPPSPQRSPSRIAVARGVAVVPTVVGPIEVTDSDDDDHGDGGGGRHRHGSSLLSDDSDGDDDAADHQQEVLERMLEATIANKMKLMSTLNNKTLGTTGAAAVAAGSTATTTHSPTRTNILSEGNSTAAVAESTTAATYPPHCASTSSSLHLSPSLSTSVGPQQQHSDPLYGHCDQLVRGHAHPFHMHAPPLDHPHHYHHYSVEFLEKKLQRMLVARELKRQSQLSPYTTVSGDYMEIVLQFGFMVMFASTFAWAPLCALFYNVIEVKIDAAKHALIMQRPIPQATRGIGQWKYIEAVLVIFAMITNAFFIAILSTAREDVGIADKNTPGDDDKWQWQSFIIIEYIIVGLVGIMCVVWSRQSPAAVRLEAKMAFMDRRLRANASLYAEEERDGGGRGLQQHQRVVGGLGVVGDMDESIVIN